MSPIPESDISYKPVDLFGQSYIPSSESKDFFNEVIGVLHNLKNSPYKLESFVSGLNKVTVENNSSHEFGHQYEFGQITVNDLMYFPNSEFRRLIDLLAKENFTSLGDHNGLSPLGAFLSEFFKMNYTFVKDYPDILVVQQKDGGLDTALDTSSFKPKIHLLSIGNEIYERRLLTAVTAFSVLPYHLMLKARSNGIIVGDLNGDDLHQHSNNTLLVLPLRINGSKFEKPDELNFIDPDQVANIIGRNYWESPIHNQSPVGIFRDFINFK